MTADPTERDVEALTSVIQDGDDPHMWPPAAGDTLRGRLRADLFDLGNDGIEQLAEALEEADAADGAVVDWTGDAP